VSTRQGSRNSMFWRDDGAPVDRFERTAADCRAHSADVAGLITELRTFGDRCRVVDLGRQGGVKFWRRLELLEAALQRVVDADLSVAAHLDEAAAREAEKRADWGPRRMGGEARQSG
jgi:hypothetical protein